MTVRPNITTLVDRPSDNTRVDGIEHELPEDAVHPGGPSTRQSARALVTSVSTYAPNSV